jgi:hypothetical protein
LKVIVVGGPLPDDAEMFPILTSVKFHPTFAPPNIKPWNCHTSVGSHVSAMDTGFPPVPPPVLQTWRLNVSFWLPIMPVEVVADFRIVNCGDTGVGFGVSILKPSLNHSAPHPVLMLLA